VLPCISEGCAVRQGNTEVIDRAGGEKLVSELNTKSIHDGVDFLIDIPDLGDQILHPLDRMRNPRSHLIPSIWSEKKHFEEQAREVMFTSRRGQD
jgi:hypothetical protein